MQDLTSGRGPADDNFSMAYLARRFLFNRFLLALILFVLFHGSSSGSATAHFQKQPATALRLASSSFAISDFDGDHYPDFANVQFGQILGPSTEYWIQLHLSTSGWQSIGLVAPHGGLLIEARDVNGDDTADLVVTTSWFKQPVAILLNDGHGGFSQVAPTAFPDAFNDSPAKLASDTAQSNQSVSTPPQSSFECRVSLDVLIGSRFRISVSWSTLS